MWIELWWNMAGGSKTEYDQLKGTDVFEFWKIFDLHREKTARDLENAKTQAAARKR